MQAKKTKAITSKKEDALNENYLNTYSPDGNLENTEPVQILKLKKRKRDFKPFKKGRFVMLNQEAVTELFSKSEIRGETLKLLMYYTSIIEYGNRIKGIQQKDIAVAINVKPSQVSRAKTELLNLGIIEEDGKDLYFNENFIQKGDKIIK